MSRLIFIVIAIYILILAVRAYLAAVRSHKRGSSAPSQGEDMVLDPQCQTYVPRSEAVFEGGNYFCSRECAKLYLSR